MSGDKMEFPETFEEFARDYGFKDDKEIYTNGSDLIPVFRVKQWLDHECNERKAETDVDTDKEPKCDKHEGVIDYIDSVIKDLNQTKMLVNHCIEIYNRDDDLDIDMCIMVLSNKYMTLYTRLIELVNKLDEDYGRYIIGKIK